MSRSPFKTRYGGVKYYIGDITKSSHVDHVVSQVKPNVIFNTASPHAYVDHEHAPEYFTINIDGNQNLLVAAAAVGTVKAYVYTSSAPIIAGSGGSYDHADESHPTLAVIQKGDPYHVAKALGDELVLRANRKHGIRTACIRPTAQYGDGDEQMIIPTLDVYKNGQTRFWMGYNDIDMDVVYVGHVARAELLCAHALLDGIVNSDAAKVDGEAFNITDDEPCPPWSFFRMYWIAAGDKTPLSSIWMFPPWFALWLAMIAEFFAWATSWGKKRPSTMKKEQIEFALYTRTYDITKARERLGFKPWVDQPYQTRQAAIQGSVDLYLSTENHGPLFPRKPSIWAERPFNLIKNTGAKNKSDLRESHYCVKNARDMSNTHNTMFRALNAIYAHATKVEPGTQDASDLLSYCQVTYTFIHLHHLMEEGIYFPEIEKAAGIPGLFDFSIEQHRQLDDSIEEFRKYVEGTRKELYSGERLRSIIDSWAPVFEEHMHTEIKTILHLHDKIDSEKLKEIYHRMQAAAEKDSDIFKIAPFVFGNQDKSFYLDGENVKFPRVSLSSFVVVDQILARRHANLWRFNPSTIYGTPRKSLIHPGSAKSSNSFLIAVAFKRFLPILLTTFSVLFAYLSTSRYHLIGSAL
ncbi:Sterol-4-alpha-carboxylate 3-decarboxylating [Hyphodiscus hymeniophilus]|uniref:Sterol-4-alpha-carboxylate 3-decarboxylating n=1 Tax=Hyphodiscus hymeniophilus TaxID=353542 RepID=A0A9P6VDT2_9HELO|nr:Sterol-4-alpha-carboxylate 3-decarboxylating [Hyphodiscus hymeniophilus]